MSKKLITEAKAEQKFYRDLAAKLVEMKKKAEKEELPFSIPEDQLKTIELCSDDIISFCTEAAAGLESHIDDLENEQE